MEPALRLVNISKSFGDVAANSNISLDINRGEILAVLGENGSGKTTLMNMVSGIYYPDSGHIEMAGNVVAIRSPRDAIDLGIGMIHQHYKLIEVFTAAENIALGLPGKLKLDRAAIVKQVIEIAEKYGFSIDPHKRIYEMSISEKQTVEIIKALYRGSSILTLDEPTAVLTPQESQRFFNILRNMRNDGKAIVMISHKLNEVMELSDKVAVLRKGMLVDLIQTKDTTAQKLTQMMVGRTISLNINRMEAKLQGLRLKLDAVSCIDENNTFVLDNLSFSIFGGEILGVAGISGNGQRELCEVITGLYPLKTGTIEYFPPDVSYAVNLSGKTPLQIRRLGIAMAFVPEDRLGMGLLAQMDMVGNLMLKRYKNGRSIFADRRSPRYMAENMIDELELVTPNVYTPVRQLSGGNIQKVLVGREISSNPTVLIAAYPTRGLDINSSHTIYRLLNEQKDHGTAVIFIGEDLDVLLELCDRILVLSDGKAKGILDARNTTKEELGLLMTQESSTV